MRNSHIGGQAVIEGVMMRHGEDVAVAVRRPDGEIEVGKSKYENITRKHKILGFPIIRGVVAFINSLVLGIRTLTYSATFYEDDIENEEGATDKIIEDTFKSKSETAVMVFTVIFSLIIAVALFILMLCTPFTYYMMHGFSQPYSRWTIFPTICLIAYVGLYLDKIKEEPKWSILVGGGSLLALVGLASIFTCIILNHSGENGIEFNSRLPLGLIAGLEAGYILIVTAVLYLLLLYKNKHFYEVPT